MAQKLTTKYDKSGENRNEVWSTINDTNYEILRERAFEQHMSIAALVREAIELYLWGEEK